MTDASATRRVRIGMGQMLVEGGKPQENLRRALVMIHKAGNRGCDVLVLPECLDLGWTDPSAAEMSEPIPGNRSDVLAEAASRAGLLVAAGLTERDGERVYNSAVLIDSDGGILLKHRKINELGLAHHLYSCGASLAVAKTAVGKVGLAICADNFPDSLCIAEALVRMGAEIILSPSAWAVDADHDNSSDPYGSLWEGSYGQIARRFGVPVVGVSNVGWITGGPWTGKKCIGASMAVGRDGSVVARGSYGADAEELIVVDLEVGRGYGWGTDVSEMLAARQE